MLVTVRTRTRQGHQHPARRERPDPQRPLGAPARQLPWLRAARWLRQSPPILPNGLDIADAVRDAPGLHLAVPGQRLPAWHGQYIPDRFLGAPVPGCRYRGLICLPPCAGSTRYAGRNRTNRACSGWPHPRWPGARVLQYRDKTTAAGRRQRLASAMQSLCRQYGACFIVNDDLALALRVECRWRAPWWCGRRSSTARRAPTGRVIGRLLLCGCRSRPRAAVAAGADYVAFGAVCPSPTKPGAVRAARHLFAAGTLNQPCRPAPSAASP